MYQFYEVIVPNDAASRDHDRLIQLRAIVQRARVRLRLPPISVSAAYVGKCCRRPNVLLMTLQAWAGTLHRSDQIQQRDWNCSRLVSRGNSPTAAKPQHGHRNSSGGLNASQRRALTSAVIERECPRCSPRSCQRVPRRITKFGNGAPWSSWRLCAARHAQ